jgi:hypothetical protein
MTEMTEVDINEILKDHVTLDIQCIDRIYLNGYIPTLQTSGQLVNFLHHRGYDIPSPAILSNMTTAYKAAVEAFAQENDRWYTESCVKSRSLVSW